MQGGTFLYDYGLSVLEQYGLTASFSGRVRGALLCRTEKGPGDSSGNFMARKKSFPCSSSFLKKWKNRTVLWTPISETGKRTGKQGQRFCSIYCTDLVWGTGMWHEIRKRYFKKHSDSGTDPQDHAASCGNGLAGRNLQEEYIRHNQEMKKIRRFIRKKERSILLRRIIWKAWNGFCKKEKKRQLCWKPRIIKICGSSLFKAAVSVMANIISIMCWYLGKTQRWRISVTGALMCRWQICIALCGKSWRNTAGICTSRRRCFLHMIPYGRSRSLSGQNLRVRFCYPEKYWKLANHYYTHNKAVISGKNVEKLRTLIHQKKQWEEFSKQCFRQ